MPREPSQGWRGFFYVFPLVKLNEQIHKIIILKNRQPPNTLKYKKNTLAYKC